MTESKRQRPPRRIAPAPSRCKTARRQKIPTAAGSRKFRDTAGFESAKLALALVDRSSNDFFDRPETVQVRFNPQSHISNV
jgi:hypothetical protein